MIRLKEAFEYAKSKGKVRSAADFAQRVWKNASRKGAYMNMNNMMNGKVNSITPGLAQSIHDELGVSADFLLGISDTISEDDLKEQVVGKAQEIIDIIK